GFEDPEIFLSEVGDELTVIVADDDVRRDELDARGEIGLALILRLHRDADRREQQCARTPRLPPGYCLHAADYKPAACRRRRCRGQVGTPVRLGLSLPMRPRPARHRLPWRRPSRPGGVPDGGTADRERLRRRRRPTTSRREASTLSYSSRPRCTSSAVTQLSGLSRSASSCSCCRRTPSWTRRLIVAETSA